MLRYKILSNNVVEVDLENGYKVVAMANWNNDKKKYYTTLLLHENTVSKWDLIEDVANIEMESDMKSIKRDMAQHVTDLLADGFFKKYIDRYEYELRCFDKGFDILEKVRNETND
ncbi:hypothetical protein [Lacrimispora sp.]|uniref:hypothetical protein n=1 Tax=Lacrimispora sp. TaxID=2719234 RepID=UPI0028AAF85A|nr:hypothetical protein [Lacrimispora sp.]